MKNRLLYRVKLFVNIIKNISQKKLFLTTTLLINITVLAPSYAETTLKQEIEQEISTSLDNEIQAAVVKRLAQLEKEAQQKNKTKDTSKTLERKQTTVKTTDTPIKKASEAPPPTPTPTTTVTDNTTQITQPTTSKPKPEKQEATVVKKTIVEKKATPVITNNQDDKKQQKEKNKEKNRNQQIVKKKAPNTTPKKTVNKANMTTIGWIYLGRFTSGQWENPTLASKALPKIKKRYKILTTSVNVRDRLPKKDETGELVLGESIKQLVGKQEVALLQLKRSGRNGHYWAKIGVIGK